MNSPPWTPPRLSGRPLPSTRPGPSSDADAHGAHLNVVLDHGAVIRDVAEQQIYQDYAERDLDVASVPRIRHSRCTDRVGLEAWQEAHQHRPHRRRLFVHPGRRRSRRRRALRLSHLATLTAEMPPGTNRVPKRSLKAILYSAFTGRTSPGHWRLGASCRWSIAMGDGMTNVVLCCRSAARWASAWKHQRTATNSCGTGQPLLDAERRLGRNRGDDDPRRSASTRDVCAARRDGNR
jgi:hypothetical protein